MKKALRRALQRAFAPLVAELDARFSELGTRLDAVERRLADIGVKNSETAARAAAGSEHAISAVESHTRLERRVQEIEFLLGADGAHRQTEAPAPPPAAPAAER